MKRSNRLVLLIGIFLALVAFVLIILLLSQGTGTGGTPAASAAPTTTKVVVATQDIPLGAVIQAGQVDLKEIAITDRPADAFGDVSLVIGQTARQSVVAGELISFGVLSDNGSLKRLEVPAGLVGMAVRVNQTSGVGTLIKAGDYVDAVVAFKIQAVAPNRAGGDLQKIGDPVTSVKALLQGMQVLGTLLPTPSNNNNNAQPQPSGSPTTGTSTSLNDQEQVAILAVTLQQAEVLNYAQNEGLNPSPMGPNGITLVLRSSKDYVDAAGSPSIPADTVTTGVLLKILIDQYGVLPPNFSLTPLPTPIPTKKP